MGCASCGSGGTPNGCKNNGLCSSGGCDKLEVYDWLSNVALPENQKPGNNSRSDAGKILDEAHPTYSSRDPKPDQRLPGLDGTGLERENNKAKILYDYQSKFPPLNAGQNEKDPAGGTKINTEQLPYSRESSEDYYQALGMPFKAVQMPKGFENLGKPVFGL
jgi:hypothetical protein